MSDQWFHSFPINSAEDISEIVPYTTSVIKIYVVNDIFGILLFSQLIITVSIHVQLIICHELS